jgi:hypothetical protein
MLLGPGAVLAAFLGALDLALLGFRSEMTFLPGAGFTAFAAGFFPAHSFSFFFFRHIVPPLFQPGLLVKIGFQALKSYSIYKGRLFNL